MPDEVNNAVAALVNALNDAGLGKVRGCTIDLQDGPEQPYRVVIEDRELPVPGVATVPPRV